MTSDHIAPPTVFVIDDDEGVRRGLARLLRSAGYAVEPLESAAEFLKRPLPNGPGCAVVDVQMPTLGGLDLQTELVARGVEIPLIFLTGHADVPTAVQAFKGGAVDFLTKPYHAKDLLQAIRKALEKDSTRRAASNERQEVQSRLSTLTSREREVLMLVVAGFLNKQIAAELGNSERTVKVHRARVMIKMKAESVAQLARMMERSGLPVGPPSRQ